MKDPARTVPRAIFIAMAASPLLYVGLQFVAQGVLGPALATSKAAPLADAAGVALGGGRGTCCSSAPSSPCSAMRAR